MKKCPSLRANFLLLIVKEGKLPNRRGAIWYPRGSYMRVIRIDEVPTESRAGDIFLGTVESKPLVGESIGAVDLQVNIITFPPGVRNKFHTHTYDQALYVLSGKGIVASEKEEVIAKPGMLFFIPRGERHWHGATKDSAFSHMSILRPGKTEY